MWILLKNCGGGIFYPRIAKMVQILSKDCGRCPKFVDQFYEKQAKFVKKNVEKLQNLLGKKKEITQNMLKGCAKICKCYWKIIKNMQNCKNIIGNIWNMSKDCKEYAKIVKKSWKIHEIWQKKLKNTQNLLKDYCWNYEFHLRIKEKCKFR